MADHDRILGALQSGDAELAGEAMRAHLENSLRLQDQSPDHGTCVLTLTHWIERRLQRARPRELER